MNVSSKSLKPGVGLDSKLRFKWGFLLVFSILIAPSGYIASGITSYGVLQNFYNHGFVDTAWHYIPEGVRWTVYFSMALVGIYAVKNSKAIKQLLNLEKNKEQFGEANNREVSSGAYIASNTDAMPSDVGFAIKIMWIALAGSFFYDLFNGVPAFVLVLQLVINGGLNFFVGKRKNWARYVYAAFVALTAVLTVVGFLSGSNAGITFYALVFSVNLILSVVACMKLFSKCSDDWFKRA